MRFLLLGLLSVCGYTGWGQHKPLSCQPCRDSLKLAMQYGKSLVKAIEYRDSLLTIRAGVIKVLDRQNVELVQKQVELQEYLKMYQAKYEAIQKRNRKHKIQKHISYVAIIILSVILIL